MSNVRSRTGFSAGARGKKKLLTIEQIEKGVTEVASLASKEGVKVVLVGGVAMHVHGSTRLTADIDFVSDGRVGALAGGKALTFGGEATVTPSGVPVDLIMRDDDYRELYEAVFDHTIKADLNGQKILVADPDILILMKMVAGRPKDLEDFRFLVVGLDAAGVERVRRLAKTHLGAYGRTEFDRAREMALLLHEREVREKGGDEE